MLKVSLPLFVAAAALGACGGDRGAASDTTTTAAVSKSSGVDLTGAGATFPYPIYRKWFDDYAIKTGFKINYANLGSGAGIRQLAEQTVDFGATDAPMTDDELARAKGGSVLHIPTALGAVAITYNLPQVAKPLRLTGPVIADVFLGKIIKWNDPRITSLNPGVSLPAADIQVVHRSDGSGTTFIFSDYLSAVSPAWKDGPGKGKDLQWPTGLGGTGNPGVAGTVKQSVGSLGYVELAYANQNRLPVAEVRNSAGRFVAPSVETIAAAAAGATNLPANTDYRISITNAPAANAYPISSFTWLLVYKNQPDAAKRKKLVDFIRWVLHEGEGQAASLDYAPLPPALVSRIDTVLNSVTTGAAR